MFLESSIEKAFWTNSKSSKLFFVYFSYIKNFNVIFLIKLGNNET